MHLTLIFNKPVVKFRHSEFVFCSILPYHVVCFLWVISQLLNSICRRFGTLCSIFIGRYVPVEWTRLRTCSGYYTGKGLTWKWPQPLAQAISKSNLFPYNTPNMSSVEFILQARTCLWRWNSVPKRRHIEFRRRGITQKKAFNIQNTAKVWNQEYFPTSFSMPTIRTTCCTHFTSIPLHDDMLFSLITKERKKQIILLFVTLYYFQAWQKFVSIQCNSKYILGIYIL